MECIPLHTVQNMHQTSQEAAGLRAGCAALRRLDHSTRMHRGGRPATAALGSTGTAAGGRTTAQDPSQENGNPIQTRAHPDGVQSLLHLGFAQVDCRPIGEAGVKVGVGRACRRRGTGEGVGAAAGMVQPHASSSRRNGCAWART